MSEPCTELASIDSAKSLRIVPAAALAGLVAPMISRFLAMAPSPSSTWTTTGPEVMKVQRSLKNGPRLVDAVELLGLRAAHPDALLGDDAQARFLEPGVDLAGQVPAGRVRLDDREGAFDGHGILLQAVSLRVGAPYDRGVRRPASRLERPFPRAKRRGPMLHVNDLTFRLAERLLLDRASATLSDGWKVGLVGRNGAGKSTLLRLIPGEIDADGGSIRLSGRPHRPGAAGPSRGRHHRPGHRARGRPGAPRPAGRGRRLPDGLRLAEIHDRLDVIGAVGAGARRLHPAGLGFDNDAQARPCGEFSGGWRMRVALAGTLFSNPDLLLLDEPSNHLDLEAMLWLTEHLRRFRHTLLMVSHDRDLLNDVCDHIVHIDQQKLVAYNGNYDRFERTRAEQLEHDAAQQAKIAAQRKHMQAFVDRFKAKASKARQAQSRVKMIERLGPIVSVPIDERDRLQLSAARAARLADRDARRGHRSAMATARLCCASSICGSTWTTASRCSARTATASRPSSACCRTDCAAARGARSSARRGCASATSRRTRKRASTTRRRRSST